MTNARRLAGLRSAAKQAQRHSRANYQDILISQPGLSDPDPSFREHVRSWIETDFSDLEHRVMSSMTDDHMRREMGL